MVESGVLAEERLLLNSLPFFLHVHHATIALKTNYHDLNPRSDFIRSLIHEIKRRCLKKAKS